ncbi:MFS transporter [Paraburkholderia sp. HP33-1]|uniref:MFS transporter n=1 Tax=Paraburkholderia sp. HP33-1 TaxID=2883243 RepID=UPI001F22F3DE|nr:MFS transporter [Paraburkholderia sp. HP33-1]
MATTGERANSDHLLHERNDTRHRWLLLLAIMVALVAAVMASVDFNVAVPVLSRHFEIGQDRVQWVVSGFMAANTAAMLTTPWLLSRFGYRYVCYGCMLMQVAGGALGGLAWNFPVVLIARVVQGIAAGAVMPIAPVVVMRAFQPHEQGRVSAVYIAGTVLVPALSPIVGGLLIQAIGWRAPFFFSAPVCLLAVWLARRYVPDVMPGGTASELDDGSSLDWLGLLLASAGTVLILNGLVAVQSRQLAMAAALLGGALAVLASFLAWQARLKRRMSATSVKPLLDLGLFRYRQFAMGCFVACTYGAALYGSTYLLPVYLQVALGLSPSFTGSVLLPSSLLLMVTLAVAGRIADRQPPYRMVSLGLLVMAASFALMIRLDVSTPLWWLIAITMFGRVGLGFVLPSLNLGAMRELPPESLSYASSSISFLTLMGGSIGVSLCGVVLQWRLSAHGVQLGGAAHSAARLASFNDVFLMVCGLCLLAMCAAWRLRPLAAGSTRQRPRRGTAGAR